MLRQGRLGITWTTLDLKYMASVTQNGLIPFDKGVAGAGWPHSLLVVATSNVEANPLLKNIPQSVLDITYELLMRGIEVIPSSLKGIFIYIARKHMFCGDW
jgi:hypothetical protein